MQRVSNVNSLRLRMEACDRTSLASRPQIRSLNLRFRSSRGAGVPGAPSPSASVQARFARARARPTLTATELRGRRRENHEAALGDAEPRTSAVGPPRWALISVAFSWKECRKGPLRGCAWLAEGKSSDALEFAFGCSPCALERSKVVDKKKTAR